VRPTRGGREHRLWYRLVEARDCLRFDGIIDKGPLTGSRCAAGPGSRLSALRARVRRRGALVPSRPAQGASAPRDRIDIDLHLPGSTLFGIEQTLRMDLFDSGRAAARHLLDRGHIRASGALLGVILEEHLKAVAGRHGFKARKKAPTITDHKEFLKAQSVIDVAMWRRIQGLADIGSLCTHAKDRAPTKENIDDLLQGVGRALKLVL